MTEVPNPVQKIIADAIRRGFESCATTPENIATAAHAALVEAGFAVVPKDALSEVLRISDRKHAAWDAVRAMIEAAETP